MPTYHFKGRAVCRPYVVFYFTSFGYYTIKVICDLFFSAVFFFFALAGFWSVVVFGFASSSSCCGVAFAARSRPSVYGRVSYYSHALSKKNHDSADHVYFAVYIFKELLPLAGSRARCSGCQQA